MNASGEGYTLHLGDCMPILASMDDQSVDITITDPPYADKTHEGALGMGGARKLVTFDSISLETFLEVCRQCVRVTRRWVIMTCDWRHAAMAESVGLPVIRLGVWIKPNGAPQFTGDRPGTGWEAVLIMHRPGAKRWNGGGHHGVWNFPKIEGVHPTEKPPKLLRKWIQQFTEKGETILDPFMGAGSTGKAALQNGRRFIGIEKDPEWFSIARDGIADASRAAQGLPKVLADRRAHDDLPLFLVKE